VLFPPCQIAFRTGTQAEEASGRTFLAPMEMQMRPSERCTTLVLDLGC